MYGMFSFNMRVKLKSLKYFAWGWHLGNWKRLKIFFCIYRFGEENETMKDEEFHDTTENVIEFGHEENVPKRKRKPSVKIEMPLTEQSILEGTYYFKKCIP